MQSVEYRFKAKLDLGGLHPSFKVRETGESFQSVIAPLLRHSFNFRFQPNGLLS